MPDRHAHATGDACIATAMVSRTRKGVTGLYRQFALACLAVAALNYAVTPTYAAAVQDSAFAADAPDELSAHFPFTEGLQSPGECFRSTADLTEDISSSKRDKDRHSRTSKDAVPQIELPALLSARWYAVGLSFLEARSRLVTAAVYLCESQEFP